MRISTLPDEFWQHLRLTQQARAEHTYADLSAAAAREDSLYFAVSAGAFVSAICALLFTINRQFEPSSRHLVAEVSMLKAVPDSFPANLDNFVRQVIGPRGIGIHTRPAANRFKPAEDLDVRGIVFLTHLSSMRAAKRVHGRILA